MVSSPTDFIGPLPKWFLEKTVIKTGQTHSVSVTQTGIPSDWLTTFKSKLFSTHFFASWNSSSSSMMYRVSKASTTVAPRRPPALQTEQCDEAPFMQSSLAQNQFAGAGTGSSFQSQHWGCQDGIQTGHGLGWDLLTGLVSSATQNGLLWRGPLFKGLTLLKKIPARNNSRSTL